MRIFLLAILSILMAVQPVGVYAAAPPPDEEPQDSDCLQTVSSTPRIAALINNASYNPNFVNTLADRWRESTFDTNECAAPVQPASPIVVLQMVEILTFIEAEPELDESAISIYDENQKDAVIAGTLVPIQATEAKLGQFEEMAVSLGAEELVDIYQKEQTLALGPELAEEQIQQEESAEEGLAPEFFACYGILYSTYMAAVGGVFPEELSGTCPTLESTEDLTQEQASPHAHSCAMGYAEEQSGIYCVEEIVE